MLEVNSSDILFDLKNDELIPYILELKNVTHSHIAYKIRSTNPDCFMVKPSRGILNSFQRENIEFSTNLNSKNYDPKSIVNQKFQISVIKIQEKLSWAQIDELFKTEAQQTVRLCTCVMKYENGKKVPIQNEKQVQSVYSHTSKNKIDSQILSSQKSESLEVHIKKLYQIEKQLTQENFKREQLFKKSTKIASKSNESHENRHILPKLYCADINRDHKLINSKICVKYLNPIYIVLYMNQNIMNKLFQYALVFLMICGITTIRSLEWLDSERDRQFAIKIGVFMTLMSLMYIGLKYYSLLFYPYFSHIYQIDNKTISQSTVPYVQKSQEKKNIIVKRNNKQKKLKSTQNTTKAKIQIINDDNTTATDLNLSVIRNTQQHSIENQQISSQESIIKENMQDIQQIIVLIHQIPEIILQKYIRMRRSHLNERRDLLKNINLFQQQYLTKTITQYSSIVQQHRIDQEILIQKGFKYLLERSEINYDSYLDTLLNSFEYNDELQHHKIFMIEQLEINQPKNTVLLKRECIEIFEFMINQLTQNKLYREAMKTLIDQNNVIHIQLVIKNLLYDEVWNYFKLEQQEIQFIQKIHQNSPELVRLQYILENEIEEITRLN